MMVPSYSLKGLHIGQGAKRQGVKAQYTVLDDGTIARKKPVFRPYVAKKRDDGHDHTRLLNAAAKQARRASKRLATAVSNGDI